MANTELFDLFEKSSAEGKNKSTLSKLFMTKYNELAKSGSVKEDDLFVATIEALELDGVHLTKPAPAPEKMDNFSSGEDYTRTPFLAKPTMRELFDSRDEDQPLNSK